MTWKDILAEEKTQPYFAEILAYIKQRRAQGVSIFPPAKDVFNAFAYTPFDELKVVILGQDPYHGPGQAHGLSFSVCKGIRQPPSLQNIFKELQDDLGIPIVDHGELTKWAKQGVMLLNAALTVEQSTPQSHAGIGWYTFTDNVIRHISDNKDHVIFVLWGKSAQAKIDLIDTTKHDIIQSPHPSPFSAHRGFFGSKPFSRINTILEGRQQDPIDWNLAE